jgi:hypothetical protein
MPRVFPADFNCLVISISSVLGVKVPAGWLCATIIEVARSVIGSAKTSLGCTCVLLTRPTETTLLIITSLAPLSERHIKCSCFRSAKWLISGSTSAGDEIFVPSGLILRRANSRAAAISAALAAAALINNFQYTACKRHHIMFFCSTSQQNG